MHSQILRNSTGDVVWHWNEHSPHGSTSAGHFCSQLKTCDTGSVQAASPNLIFGIFRFKKSGQQNTSWNLFFFKIYYSFVCSVFACLIQPSHGGGSKKQIATDISQPGWSGHSYLISKCLLSVLHDNMLNKLSAPRFDGLIPRSRRWWIFIFHALGWKATSPAYEVTEANNFTGATAKPVDFWKQKQLWSLMINSSDLK